jgi:hypothetical protein
MGNGSWLRSLVATKDGQQNFPDSASAPLGIHQENMEPSHVILRASEEKRGELGWPGERLDRKWGKWCGWGVPRAKEWGTLSVSAHSVVLLR